MSRIQINSLDEVGEAHRGCGKYARSLIKLSKIKTNVRNKVKNERFKVKNERYQRKIGRANNLRAQYARTNVRATCTRNDIARVSCPHRSVRITNERVMFG